MLTVLHLDMMDKQQWVEMIIKFAIGLVPTQNLKKAFLFSRFSLTVLKKLLSWSNNQLTSLVH